MAVGQFRPGRLEVLKSLVQQHKYKAKVRTPGFFS